MFIVAIFAPLMAFFFLSLAFYRLPMQLNLQYGLTTTVGAPFVRKAVLVCVVWFGVAIGIVLWPLRRAATPRAWTPSMMWMALVGFSVVGGMLSLAHSLVRFPSSLEEVVNQLAFAPVIAVVLGVQQFGSLRRRGAPGTAVGLVWLLILFDLGVTLVVPLGLAKVGPAAVGAIAILYGVGVVDGSWRRPVLALLLVVPLMVVALPLKDALRQDLYGGHAFLRGGRAILAPLRSSLQATARQIREFDPQAAGLRAHQTTGVPQVALFIVGQALSRINRLADLAYVTELTPAAVPYAGGTTYRPLLTKLVPRALWRNGPQEVAGQWYGHRYKFLDPEDTATSVNLPVVTEGWISGGWIGVIGSAALLGIVLRVIWAGWLGENSAPGNVMLGMVVVASATDLESNLSLILGGVIHGFLLYWLVDICIRRIGARLSPPAA
ncbi:MAG TPA: hypothetical protein VK587_09550 [bacterium]|nr:hypothetical protein [bacterium]